jgi:hypothetical protein
VRVLVLVGILLIGAGAWAATGRATYPSERSVLEVGEFRASVEAQRSVPPWVGVLGIVVGLGCVVAGRRRRG